MYSEAPKQCCTFSPSCSALQLHVVQHSTLTLTPVTLKTLILVSSMQFILRDKNIKFFESSFKLQHIFI